MVSYTILNTQAATALVPHCDAKDGWVLSQSGFTNADALQGKLRTSVGKVRIGAANHTGFTCKGGNVRDTLATHSAATKITINERKEEG